MGNKGKIAALLMDNADMWAESQNAGGKVNFNVDKSPYDVWNGKYTAIRPRGATYAHPEGIDAAYDAEKQKYPGIIGLLNKYK
jgi:hypothetical protein